MDLPADVTAAPAEEQPRTRPSEAAILDFSQETGNIVSGFIHNGNAEHYLKRAICTLEAAVMEQENSIRGMKRRIEEMKRERDRIKRRNWQNNTHLCTLGLLSNKVLRSASTRLTKRSDNGAYAPQPSCFGQSIFETAPRPDTPHGQRYDPFLSWCE